MTQEKCSFRDCAGEYERRLVTHAFTRQGKVIVVKNIPAKVCSVCGDTILLWRDAERLLKFLEIEHQPVQFAPVYQFAPLPA